MIFDYDWKLEVDYEELAELEEENARLMEEERKNRNKKSALPMHLSKISQPLYHREDLKMQKERLQEILESHKKWLRGKDGKKADLRCADLRGVDLRGVDLRWADLRGVDLRWANLRWADLKDVDLRCADLKGANLKDVDLRCADLKGVDLRWADLRGVDLREANLKDADLRCADLRGTDLDYSSFPLWCGSFDIIVDERLIHQLCYHIAKLKYAGNDSDIKTLLESDVFKSVANKFHRVEECEWKNVGWFRCD